MLWRLYLLVVLCAACLEAFKVLVEQRDTPNNEKTAQNLLRSHCRRVEMVSPIAVNVCCDQAVRQWAGLTLTPWDHMLKMIKFCCTDQFPLGQLNIWQQDNESGENNAGSALCTAIKVYCENNLREVVRCVHDKCGSVCVLSMCNYQSEKGRFSSFSHPWRSNYWCSLTVIIQLPHHIFNYH